MIDELFGKRIVIMGLARQGKAFARFAAEAGADVVVSDLKSPEQLGPEIEEISGLVNEFVLGDHPDSLLDKADVLVVSGGVSVDVPFVKKARSRGLLVTNDSLEFAKRSQAPVIGITGSAGKTTTTALTGAIIRASGQIAWVGGNIGRPLISELEMIGRDDIAVQELSSFQLELWTQSPPIAAVLNITPNHLDRHKTMEAYSAAKSNIIRYQNPDDIAVLSADDKGVSSLRRVVRSRLREFSLELKIEDGAYIRDGVIWLRDGSSERFVLELDQIPLRGRHNLLNVLASTVLADSVGVAAATIRDAVIAFEGVEHRLEIVGVINGVQYVNDSIATAPERSIAAINSFVEPIVLLAGGRDKEMDWSKWAQQVIGRVKAVILFGELAQSLESSLLSAEESVDSGKTLIIERVETMEEATWRANTIATPNDVVLLSPGGTSFDAYNDFAERGRVFRELVNEIAKKTNNVSKAI
jgi:UDP-N-acetylmuramoylalanine--D-glutamate ligase